MTRRSTSTSMPRGSPSATRARRAWESRRSRRGRVDRRRRRRPAARRSGVGEALMRALHEQARERGVRRVWLEVIAENTAAFELYEKLGYRLSATSRSGRCPLSDTERAEADDVCGRTRTRASASSGRTRAVAARRRTLDHYADAARARHRCAAPASTGSPERGSSSSRSPAKPNPCSAHSGLSARQRPQPARRTIRPRRHFALSPRRSSFASTRCCSSSRALDSTDVRIALVTPFAWSQPHDVNEHVDGLARELRRRGHAVTVLAPSNRARDLAAGRRALLGTFDDPELIALGPAVPISRRSRMGVPVGVRASLSLALARAASTSCTASSRACRASRTWRSATPQRSRLQRSSRPTARLSPGPGAARAAARRASTRSRDERRDGRSRLVRFPGRYELVPHGIDPELFAPAAKTKLVVLEWRQTERPLLRALVRELAQ